jgi:RNA polymerase sigma-70 factor (ECF subfamily)
MKETELGRRLLAGDPQVLEEIIDVYGSLVYRLVARILAGSGDRRDVEECCSDAFLEVQRKREQFDPARSGFQTWVLMLARYQALNYRRRWERKNNPAGNAIPVEDVPPAALTGGTVFASPERLVLKQEEREKISAALALLAVSEREILYRRYYLEQSVGEIAETLGISRGAVDSRLWRARRRLKERLRNDQIDKVVSLYEEK